MSDTIRLAQAVGACRRAALASGNGMRLQEIEVLLWIAAGVDHVADIQAAMEAHRVSTHRSLRFLGGRDSSGSPHGSGIRVSPFQLIEYRKHPHRRGFQYRLTAEGFALLSPCLQLQSQPNWSDPS